MREPFHIAVVGGGIAGLSAAYHLVRHNDGEPLHVSVIESEGRLGGKLRTETFAGQSMDVGPDAFLARLPWATQLCRELGLQDELVSPATGKSWLWTRGRLRELPDGLVMGVPTRVFSIARSGLLSLPGVLRAGLDLILPRQKLPPDPSVADIIGPRLGNEVLTRIVEPLISGIHAGRADHLSMNAVAPQLAKAAEQHRSLIAGLSHQPKPASSGPTFYTLKKGLGRLVERLQDELHEVEWHLNTSVRSLSRRDGRYYLTTATGSEIIADGIILAVPAWSAAQILRSQAQEAARELASIEHASVAIVTLAYPIDAFPRLLNGSGFLAPRIEGHLMTACTWSTNKWPWLGETGYTILRCSVGRLGDERAMQLDESELVERLHAELVEVLGITQAPSVQSVTHWERAFPQYEPGHQERVGRIENALSSLPALQLAGAAYHGLGIPACIHDGALAAARLRKYFKEQDGRV